jgi:hypothetical protein
MTDKQSESECAQAAERTVNWAFGAEQGVEIEDFELDQIVRKLALDRWFAFAEEGLPFWVP